MKVSPDSVTGTAAAPSAARTATEHNLHDIIEHLAHLLPAQGPITAFVHHNTLHAFEDLPFHEAVKKGLQIFGCQPYLSEERYRELLDRERIRNDDLWAVLLDDLGDEDVLIGRLATRFHLRLVMLQYPLRMAPTHELRWLVAESDALAKFRPETPAPVRKRIIEQTRHWVMRDLRNGKALADKENDEQLQELLSGLFRRFSNSRIEQWSDDTWESFCLQLLWRVCQHGVRDLPHHTTPAHAIRHRNLLMEATGTDSDLPLHDLLIRYCAAFLDQGFAGWPLPHRSEGFYRCFLKIYGQPGGPPDQWMRGLSRELQRLSDSGTEPMDSIAESLDLLGLEPSEYEQYISESLLALPGWAGMIWQMETRGDRVAHPAPAGSLIEYLAVRLILTRFSLAFAAKETLGYTGPLSELRQELRQRIPQPAGVTIDQRAFLVFQLAQILGWKPEELYEMTKSDWATLVREIESFSNLERRRIYQNAYERRFNNSLLDAVTVHSERVKSTEEIPRFQLCCCIDDREESFRRHLEEIEPACETFGFAGFYAVAMYYRGAAEAHYMPLCPVVIKPDHYVREEVGFTFGGSHRRRAETRKAIGTATHRYHVGSRTFLGGIITSLCGPLASIPMVARILFPRTTAQIRKIFGRLVQPPPITQLLLERSDDPPGPDNGHVGYTVEEMADIVERVLRDIGLTSRFSRLVVITGHGSSSLNNPHESAYNCGACAGGRGGPNARAFSRMANDPRIRHILEQRGLTVPGTTYFVGAYHNTCDESMVYYDLDRLPASHWELFEEVEQRIDEARERNAHERCRRFESARLTLTPTESLWHVETRAEDLSQARPEYNHATNAMTIVGRRERTRGLFLDRRAFLTSYDPTQDDENHTILGRILQAAVPVCAGISLEYYFSCVDPDGWGCGSKLPHNVTSLLGVMLGAASDLKPGLSAQMIEIHEPIRQVFIIETTPDAMLQIMGRDENVRRLCMNDWVYLATLDPHSSTIHVLKDGHFELYQPTTNELPTACSSADWYRGWRDHLGFASIDAASPDRATKREHEMTGANRP